jgi:hypothetical protein
MKQIKENPACKIGLVYYNSLIGLSAAKLLAAFTGTIMLFLPKKKAYG